MDNQSFNDLGFHPEGGFTFDDLYTPSNDTTEEQYNKAAEDIKAEKDRMHQEVYGDLPNAEDLFGGSSEPAKEEKTEQSVEVPEAVEEPLVSEPEPAPAPEVETPVYTEPVTISYGTDVTMPEEPDYTAAGETEEVAESIEEPAEESNAFVDDFNMTPTDGEVEEVDSEDDMLDEGEPDDFEDSDEYIENFQIENHGAESTPASDVESEPEAIEEPVSESVSEPASDPAIDKILPDAYPINENREVEEPAQEESGEPVFDIFTPHTEEPNFDGLDEFSRSLLMGAGVVPAASPAPAPEPTPVEQAPAEPMGFDSLEEPVQEESIEESTDSDNFVDNFGANDEIETEVSDVEEPEETIESEPEIKAEPETDDFGIDSFDTPISIADPVVPEVPETPVVPLVDDIDTLASDDTEEVEEPTEETEEPAEEPEEIVAAPVVSVEGLHKDNVKKLNKAFAEFKEDMLRKDMESIFYGANEIMSKEAILYTYMGNEYTENQEKAIADIDGYRFLNDVYEKSVEIRHDSEEKGEKQEFPETIKAALVAVVGTNEYLYNIRNGADV